MMVKPVSILSHDAGCRAPGALVKRDSNDFAAFMPMIAPSS